MGVKHSHSCSSGPGARLCARKDGSPECNEPAQLLASAHMLLAPALKCTCCNARVFASLDCTMRLVNKVLTHTKSGPGQPLQTCSPYCLSTRARTRTHPAACANSAHPAGAVTSRQHGHVPTQSTVVLRTCCDGCACALRCRAPWPRCCYAYVLTSDEHRHALPTLPNESELAFASSQLCNAATGPHLKQTHTYRKRAHTQLPARLPAVMDVRVRSDAEPTPWPR